jgi:uncharacterized damage-inducible protein DinB
VSASAARTPDEARALLAHLSTVLRRNGGLLRRVTADVDDAAARQALVPGGSHLAWLLAHLVVSRDGMLRRCGGEAVWDERAWQRFGRGSDVAVDTPTIAVALAALEAQEARLLEAFAAIAAGAGADAAPPIDLDTVEFLVWHETYHMGQALLYRRAAGLPSPIG